MSYNRSMHYWLGPVVLALGLLIWGSRMATNADVLTRRVETINGDGTKTVKTEVTTTSDVPQASREVIVTTSPSTVFALLDSRRFELERLIASRLVNGQITAGDALKLRSKLDDLSAQIETARLAGYSVVDPRVVDLGKQLDIVGAQAAGLLAVAPLTPITVIDTSTGQTKIAVDSFGNVVAISTVQPTMYSATLDARRSQLQSLIATGEAAGTLPHAQASAFRMELDRLTALENAAAAAGITTTNVLPIALQMDTLRDQIIAYTHTPQLQPLIIGERFILSNNQVAMLDDVMVRRADLEARIANQLAAGRISQHQAASLLAQMDEIAREEAAMRADGNLSFKESRQLYTAFDRVATKLDGDIANR